MTTSEPPPGAGELPDTRGPARGWGRLVMVLYWVFAIITTIPALWFLIREGATPIGPQLVAVAAGLVYVLAAVGITHNGQRMRRIAWACVIVAFVGPLIVGLWGLGGAPTEPHACFSAWADFGRDYWYTTLLVPLIGMWWLWFSDPRRIVTLSQARDV